MILFLSMGCLGETQDDTADKHNEAFAPWCEDTVTSVSLSEKTALGFAAQDVLDLAVGKHQETWVYNTDQITTGIAVTVTAGKEARFVDSEAVYPDTGTVVDIAPVCEDRIEVDVSMALVTEDGAFDETLASVVSAVGVGEASFNDELDIDALSGTFDFDALVAGKNYDDRSLWVAGGFDKTGSFGNMSAQISGQDECDSSEECVAWAANLPVGMWGDKAF